MASVRCFAIAVNMSSVYCGSRSLNDVGSANVAGGAQVDGDIDVEPMTRASQSSDGMKENHVDEACGLTPDLMLDACVAMMVAAEVAVVNKVEYETVVRGARDDPV